MRIETKFNVGQKVHLILLRTSVKRILVSKCTCGEHKVYKERYGKPRWVHGNSFKVGSITVDVGACKEIYYINRINSSGYSVHDLFADRRKALAAIKRRNKKLKELGD